MNPLVLELADALGVHIEAIGQVLIVTDLERRLVEVAHVGCHDEVAIGADALAYCARRWGGKWAT